MNIDCKCYNLYKLLSKFKLFFNFCSSFLSVNIKLDTKTKIINK